MDQPIPLLQPNCFSWRCAHGINQYIGQCLTQALTFFFTVPYDRIIKTYQPFHTHTNVSRKYGWQVSPIIWDRLNLKTISMLGWALAQYCYRADWKLGPCAEIWLSHFAEFREVPQRIYGWPIWWLNELLSWIWVSPLTE